MGLVRLEGLPHISHGKGLYRTGTGIPVFHALLIWHPLSIAIQAQSSLSAQQVCTVSPAFKCHPGPAQFGNAKKCSIFIVQAASTNYIFISYSARLITMKKSFLTKTHCKCWTQLHDHPAPLCIHCPSSPLWCRLVQTSSHWETPVLKAAVWDMGVGACGKFPWAPEELLPSHGSSLAECRS